MFELSTLMVLIPALPLLAALVIAALGKPLLGERSHWPALIATAGSFVQPASLWACSNEPTARSTRLL